MNLLSHQPTPCRSQRGQSPHAAEDKRDRPIAILGAGISGLTLAWHLQRAGHRVVVLEKSLRPGGAIGGRREGEWFHEGGPNSLFESSAAVRQLVDSLGLRERSLAAAPEAKKRYIVRRGNLTAMPASPLEFIASPLLSWPAKFQLLGEPFRPRSAADADESVAEFVTRRLGREFLDYVVNPFVAGVYAGDPRHLSVRHAFPKLHALEQAHGSLMRGALQRRNPTGAPRGQMLSFPSGLEELPNALARALGDALHLGCTVETVRRDAQGWTVEYVNGNDRYHSEFAAVVCMVPADTLAQLRWSGVSGAAGLARLRALKLPPVVSVFTGYLRSDVPHPLDGFGFLVPEKERRQILGTLFSSTLFPGRAPAGHVALTTFVGGTRQPATALLEDRDLLDVVHTELQDLLGVKADPVYTHLQRWPRAIPQYDRDFGAVKQACAAAEASAPGLFIGGNCRDGISLANCIEAAERLATRVHAWASEKAASH